MSTAHCRYVRLFALFAGLTLLPVVAAAQGGYYLVPSVSLVEGHDDNLFFAIDDEQSDLFTRLSPALTAGFESEALNWDARYSFDAEDYDKRSSLDSGMVRRFADASVEYRPGARWVLAGETTFTKTTTPMDLSLNAVNVIPGLLVGRAEAARTFVHPSLQYRFTPATTALVGYTQTNDKLYGAIESDIDQADVEFSTRLSERSVFSYGYIYRKYRFDVPVGAGIVATDTGQHSQTPWIGMQYELGPRSTLAAELGPRIYESSTRPFVLVSYRHAYADGSVQLAYERNETTLLGQVGRVESETLSATLIHRVGANLELQFAPGYAETSQEGFAVDIAGLMLQARYRVNSALSLMASYQLNQQQVDFVDGRVSKVARNVIMIGFTLAYPRPNRTAAP